MASIIIGKWLLSTRVGRPGWWAGPILQKELRVASRRRRSYLLRCAYVLLLTMYIAMVWVSAVSYTFIPFAQAFALVATTLEGYYGDVRWFGYSLDAGELIPLMLFSMVGHIVVALLFAWRAVRAFRRRML